MGGGLNDRTPVEVKMLQRCCYVADSAALTAHPAVIITHILELRIVSVMVGYVHPDARRVIKEERTRMGRKFDTKPALDVVPCINRRI